jgi:hypothetical protein
MITESRIFNINSQSGTKNNGSKNTNIDYYLPNFVNNQFFNINSVNKIGITSQEILNNNLKI